MAMVIVSCGTRLCVAYLGDSRGVQNSSPRPPLATAPSAARCEADDGIELVVGDRKHREAIASREEAAVGELGQRTKFVERHKRQFPHRCNRHPVPTRI